MGTTIARVLLDRGIRVRFVEGRAERAREVAEEHAGRPRLPRQRVRSASSSSASASAAPPPPCSRSTTIPATCSAPILAKTHGVKLTIALAHDQSLARGLRARRRRRRDQPAPGDRRGARALRPRPAHPPDRDARRRPLRDPRPDGAAGVRARRHAASTSCRRPARVIGAIIRDGSALFPHGQRRAAAPATA